MISERAPLGGNLSVQHQVKIIMLGESTVGKTSLIMRFARKQFNISMVKTVGVDCATQLVEIEEDGSKQTVKMDIWDTAGQERYHCITTQYMRGVNGALLVYDISHRATFEKITDWLHQMPDADQTKILVGNKSDLDAYREVSPEEGAQLAGKHAMQFFETSARLDINVNTAFNAIAMEIIENAASSAAPTENSSVNLGSSHKSTTECSGRGPCAC